MGLDRGVMLAKVVITLQYMNVSNQHVAYLKITHMSIIFQFKKTERRKMGLTQL